MKLTLKRNDIVSGVNSIIKEAISNGELSITEVSDLEPEYVPQVVIDYMKEKFKSKTITLEDSFGTFDAFTLKSFMNNFRCPDLYAERLFDEIFKDLSVNLEGSIEDFCGYGDTLNYQVNDYYATLDLSDAATGGTVEYILQVDDNGNLVLPEFDEVTIEIEKEHILDTPETRKWMLDNVDKEV
jgi:hypothetical protein